MPKQALANMNTLQSACTGILQMAGPTYRDDILYVKEPEITFIPPLPGSTFIMTDFNEQTALDGLRKLDSQTVGAVYDRYFPEVYRYVRYRIGDDIVAEDIASDVFVRLLEASRKKQGPQSNLRGWLIATALNAVNDHHRRHYRRPVEALSEAMPDGGPGIHSQVDAREQQRLVQGALAQLTAEQQHVLALRFGQGYSLEETASLLNKNVNAVKALQFRALASLQRQMGEVNYE
jgi:RNA polymerase sigma-70 factor, ECF subfamily